MSSTEGPYVTLAIEILKLELARNRRFLEILLQVASPSPTMDDE